MKEIFTGITNYPNYEVSNLGNVKSKGRISIQNKVIKEKYLKKQETNKGYLFVYISNSMGKKMFMIHRLVADAFIPNPENKPTVNHKFGIKSDNRVSELEWATYSENNKHSYRILGNIPSSRGKFGENAHRSKKILCVSTGDIFSSRNEAAKKFNICASNISQACNGVYKTTNGMIFKYI